jgi:hypothetical protein
VYEALVQPNRDPSRPWLTVLDDEQLPEIGKTEEFTLVTWSSLWLKRPDAVVRFDLDGDSSGTNLRWTVLVVEPPPDDALLGHIRKRMNQLINASLRYSFGQ